MKLAPDRQERHVHRLRNRPTRREHDALGRVSQFASDSGREDRERLPLFRLPLLIAEEVTRGNKERHAPRVAQKDTTSCRYGVAVWVVLWDEHGRRAGDKRLARLTRELLPLGRRRLHRPVVPPRLRRGKGGRFTNGNVGSHPLCRSSHHYSFDAEPCGKQPMTRRTARWAKRGCSQLRS